MFGDETGDESFEETVRSIASELGRSVERAIENVNLNEFADAVGVDSGAAREWVDSAGSWLRTQVESLGGEAAFRVGYESPSQFGREYRRLFGSPPRRDVAVLRLESQPTS